MPDLIAAVPPNPHQSHDMSELLHSSQPSPPPTHTPSAAIHDGCVNPVNIQLACTEHLAQNSMTHDSMLHVEADALSELANATPASLVHSRRSSHEGWSRRSCCNP